LPLISAGQALGVLVDVSFFVAVSSFCSPLEVVRLWNLLLSFLSLLLGSVWLSALATPSLGLIRIPGAFLPVQLRGAFPAVSPTDLGTFSAILVASALYRLLDRRRIHFERKDLLWVSVLVLGLISLIFSQSRTPVAALALAIVAIVWMTRRLDLFPMLAGCGVLLVAVGFGEGLRDYYMRGQSLEGFYSLTGRTGIWEAAWNLFKESPMLGHGFFTANRLDLASRLSDKFTIISTAENTFLEVLLGVGLVGLFPMLVALLQTAGRLLRNLRDIKFREGLREPVCQIVSAMIIVFVRAFDGPTFQDHSVCLFIFLISMAIVHTLATHRVAEERLRHRLNRCYRPHSSVTFA
jgi:O-antigen ligase